MFLREGQEEDATAAIKEGNFIKIKGITTIDKFDGELTIGSIVGIKKSEDFTSKRVDNAPVKRVELHCHTKMSDMDGVSEVKDLVKRAKKWGMPAWRSQTTAVSRRSRTRTMPLTKGILLRSSTVSRDIWWTT